LAVERLLSWEGYGSTLYDIGSYADEVFDKHDIFLCATPWQATEHIMRNIAKRSGKIYFDLTEDVEIGRNARKGSKSVMIPHCGLAPGAVSIIAASMFPANKIDLRVGAIPVNPTGALKYHLNWSTDGLVNECLKPCPAIIDGEFVQLAPLDDLISFLGPDGYEAFNTSGGVGTLAETLLGKSSHVRYQTIRYQGHRDLFRFLVEDLKFKDHPDDLVKLLDSSLPQGGDDKIVIRIDADRQAYRREIFGHNDMSAIQYSTAAGVVAAMIWAIRKDLTKIDGQVNLREGNWIANEDIPREDLQDISVWKTAYET